MVKYKRLEKCLEPRLSELQMGRITNTSYCPWHANTIACNQQCKQMCHHSSNRICKLLIYLHLSLCEKCLSIRIAWQVNFLSFHFSSINPFLTHLRIIPHFFHVFCVRQSSQYLKLTPISANTLMSSSINRRHQCKTKKDSAVIITQIWENHILALNNWKLGKNVSQNSVSETVYHNQLLIIERWLWNF